MQDGAIFLVMTDTGIRYAPRLGTPLCTSPCASCANSIPTMCFTCISGYYLSTTIPNTCVSFSCHSSCATCSDGTSTGCLSCPSGFVLSGAAPSSCVPVCHASCTTCSDNSSTGCLSCPSGYQLSVSPGPSSCVPTCDSSCATCSAPGASNCLSCPIGRSLAGAAPNACVQPVINTTITCHQTCLTCTGSLQTQCASCAVPLFLNTSTSTCIDCFLYPSFQQQSSLCSIPSKQTIYLDWTVSLSWMTKTHSQLLANFSLIVPPDLLKDTYVKGVLSSKLQPLVNTAVSAR